MSRKVLKIQVYNLNIQHPSNNVFLRRACELPSFTHPLTLCVPVLRATMDSVSQSLHASCICRFFFGGGGFWRGRSWLKLASNPSQTPAAVATSAPHPLPGRQHLIKMARKLCPLLRRSVLRLGFGGGESSRLHWDSWYSDHKTTAKWILYQ